MKKLIRLALVGLLLVSFISQANDVEGVYTVIIKKQAEKKSTRWTLSDWLTTKKRMALMDQWLALNTKTTLFEGRFGGSTGSVKETTDVENKKTSNRYEAELLVRMFGLAAETGNLGPHQKFSSAELELMILGSSLQSTSLRGFYGLRKLDWENVGKFDQYYYGGTLTIYLFNFLGVDGRYQSFSKAKDDDKVDTASGNSLSLGAFLDLSFVRLGAKLYSETLKLEHAGVVQPNTKNKGTLFTASIFF